MKISLSRPLPYGNGNLISMKFGRYGLCWLRANNSTLTNNKPFIANIKLWQTNAPKSDRLYAFLLSFAGECDNKLERQNLRNKDGTYRASHSALHWHFEVQNYIKYEANLPTPCTKYRCELLSQLNY